MQQERQPNLPIELSQVSRASVTVIFGIAIVVTGALWVIGKTASMQFLALALAGYGLTILYIQSTTVRLDEAGISKGLPLISTFIPFERVARVSKEVLLRRGSPTVFVVSERDSGRRIIIPFLSLDRVRVAQLMTELSHRAPQAHIEEATCIQLCRR